MDSDTLDFTNELICADELSEDQKDAFKEFGGEKVREGNKANREASEKRKKTREDLSKEKVVAYEKMKFFKFYPILKPDTPDVSSVKPDFAAPGLNILAAWTEYDIFFAIFIMFLV